MRVLMLGWEFPPHLSGGIGTACEGLTRALSEAGVEITFVLPEHAGEVDPGGGSVLTTLPAAEDAREGGTRVPEVWVADAELAEEGARARVRPGLGFGGPPATPGSAASTVQVPADNAGPAGFSVERVDARLPNAYDAAATRAEAAGTIAGDAGGRLWGGVSYEPSGEPAATGDADARPPAGGRAPAPAGRSPEVPSGVSPSEILGQTRRYADACVTLARRLAGEAEATGGAGFDAVHAHDWTTFPAGVAVAAALGVPLVVHVHATEYDRNGEAEPGEGHPIRRIEAEGFSAARRVLAVSRRTRAVLEERYGVDPAKIRVVYNAATPAPASASGKVPGAEVEPAAGAEAASGFTAGIGPDDRVVLFLGRLTAQKGPGYFLEAAKAVLARRPDTTFVVAGSGDRLEESMQKVKSSGIAERFVFTGFLRGDDVRAMYDRADVYVMPSVSEPFGIAPLEAAQRGVPVIISKQSGVSEVLDHALKVDFWDTEELANQILAVLNHQALGATMRAHASVQVRKLTWSGAADRVIEAYREAAGG